MEKISVKERLPTVGIEALVYGYYVGEIDDKHEDKSWYHVFIQENGYYVGIGGDYYSWSVEDIDFWIDLSELYK
jgi:hypothetical protein